MTCQSPGTIVTSLGFANDDRSHVIAINHAAALKELGETEVKAEALYDRLSPQYWGAFGFYENETHLAYLQKFLARVAPGGPILSAACGADRYDSLLLEVSHMVTGIDQSEGTLARKKKI